MKFIYLVQVDRYVPFKYIYVTWRLKGVRSGKGLNWKSLSCPVLSHKRSPFSLRVVVCVTVILKGIFYLQYHSPCFRQEEVPPSGRCNHISTSLMEFFHLHSKLYARSRPISHLPYTDYARAGWQTLHCFRNLNFSISPSIYFYQEFREFS